ncbi:MAG: aminotransferase class IV [Bdellovibrio sp.]
MSVSILSPVQVLEKLKAKSYPAQSFYLAMYSTWWGGVVTEPGLMFVPVDDHLVHRGDGVFEAIKVLSGKIFLLDEHLARLQSSAQSIGLTLPMSIAEIKSVIISTTVATEVREAMLRLYVSRGPGGFTTNPYDSVASQLYLIVTSFNPYPEGKYVQGVKVGRSQIPPKDPWLAQIKSCNYLSNVLMKKESVDRKLDFTIGLDAQGFITEGSTENIVIVDAQKNLVRPRLRQILKGTTMMRAFDLAQRLQSSGLIRACEERDVSEKELMQASEVMMIGTTLDVLPVTEYEGQKIGEGQPGPVARELRRLLVEDIERGPKATPIY